MTDQKKDMRSTVEHSESAAAGHLDPMAKAQQHLDAAEENYLNHLPGSLSLLEHLSVSIALGLGYAQLAAARAARIQHQELAEQLEALAEHRLVTVSSLELAMLSVYRDLAPDQRLKAIWKMEEE